jgi:hypothetical protein
VRSEERCSGNEVSDLGEERHKSNRQVSREVTHTIERDSDFGRIMYRLTSNSLLTRF